MPVPEDVAALRQRVAQLEAALTAQQHGEQARRDAKDAAAQIVETVREPLLVLTPDFRVQSANPAFYELFQVRPAETIGQRIYQLGNGQWDIPEFHTLLEQILPQQTVFNDYEVSHDFARIGPRTILLNARRLDNVQFILLAMEDITARKQAETQLQQHHAQLEQQVEERTAALRGEMAERQRLEAERQRLEREAHRVQHFALLGRLAAGVSHDLRNPLGAIFLHVDLLDEELREPSAASATEIAHALAEIKTQLARVDALIQDYLALVRVAAIQQAPGPLGRLVTQWAQEMAPALAAHGITLQLEALDQLGMVALHAHTLQRALLNLVQNAMEAMPPGGTLTLRGRRQGATVSLDVCDTGGGMPPEQTTQIFEPLYTTKPGGTGLGLYIVQEVIAAHGGQITVQSVVGQGSTFTITLPLLGQEETT
ncbi:MAG TPA: ATP-binding protein [Candidatus Tectomicrobia bacterium]